MIKTSPIDKFIDDISTVIEREYSHENDRQMYRAKLKADLLMSGIDNIEWCEFSVNSMGYSYPKGILVNKLAGFRGLPLVTFVICHEIAHILQDNKYGIEWALGIFKDEIPLKKAIKTLKYAELTADRFAAIKFNEYVRVGLFTIDQLPKANNYDSYTEDMFRGYINEVKEHIGSAKTTPEIISTLYKWVKND